MISSRRTKADRESTRQVSWGRTGGRHPWFYPREVGPHGVVIEEGHF